jgi:hypothetical protein
MLFVDASDYAVGCVLAQIDPTGKEQPVAFASNKFTPTQCNWATIEKEAYACIWALQKYRHWLFGSVTTLYSDHNPLTYLSESSPKSARPSKSLTLFSSIGPENSFKLLIAYHAWFCWTNLCRPMSDSR